jgi:ATP-dependent DNA helicase RecG
MDLSSPLRFLKGMGPARAKTLARLELCTLGDLLEHYPRGYLDRSQITELGALVPGSEVTSIGTVRSVSQRRTRGGMRNVHVLLDDGTGRVECVWFNQPYLERVFQRGMRVLVSGRVEWFQRLQFKNPEYETLENSDPGRSANGSAGESDSGPDAGSGGEAGVEGDDAPGVEGDDPPGIVPVYPLTAGISQKVMRRLLRHALDVADPLLGEFMPDEIVESHDLLSWRDAQRQMHFPESQESLQVARRRIAFQELFDLQLLLAINRRRHEQPRTARPLRGDGHLVQPFVRSLPFRLTRAQERVISQIRDDLAKDHPMHRLLEGDVGSGKTWVALAAGLVAVEAGAQVAFMAPTEILAAQHAQTFARLCEPLGVRTACLTGGLAARRANEVRAAIREGQIQIALGTHALIQKEVTFRSLGLVIVDEQHRFGVLQRARLQGKGRAPHALIMTATPIPRTLALTLFGDLDISVLDEKPAGRVAPKTHLVPESRYEEMLQYVARELRAGAQAYFVCPLIEASEDTDLKAATELYERLQSHELLRDFRGALLHGRMKSEEKDAVMQAFVAGTAGFLVATTVIEVGVDVPNASIMVIEHPERYGLSQLHQLRGRIGRGRQPAHLFLLRRDVIGEEARKRIEVLVRENDGFRIAEEDLRQRGPGEFFGVRQSGLPPLKVADPVGQPALLEEARGAAFNLVSSGDARLLSGTPLGHRLEARFGERIRLYKIG